MRDIKIGMLSRGKKVSPFDFLQTGTPDVVLNSGSHIGAPKPYTNMASLYKAGAKVRETFRQISQKLWAAKTSDLDKLFIY